MGNELMLGLLFMGVGLLFYYKLEEWLDAREKKSNDDLG